MYTIAFDGRRHADEYPTQEAAAEAIRLVMGWETIVLSPPYAVGDGSQSAVSAYRTEEECSADQEGAYAPRITETDDLLPVRPTEEVLAWIAGDGPDPWAGADPVLDALDRAPPAVDDVSPDELVEVRRRAEDVRGRP